MASNMSKARSLAARTVHIKIFPTPQNFTESRVVLQELEQKFGEIATFRSLKYHPISSVPNAATAIFQTESAAKAALDAARHRYGLVLEPSEPVSPFVGPSIPPAESETDAQEAASNPEEPPKVKEFQLDIWPSDFMHERYIRSPATNPLYGPFKPVSPKDSLIGGMLKQSLPPSPSAKGLMDWETDDVRRKRGHAGLEADIEGSGYTTRSGGATDHATSGYTWRQQRKQARAAPRVMQGLRTLKEESQQKEKDARRWQEVKAGESRANETQLKLDGEETT